MRRPAGSERYSGDRSQAGGGSINAGLLALGKVLTGLKNGQSHIPYRDSLLTRMLKDSLAGDCKTMVLACINPGFLEYQETKNVLAYVHRATRAANATADDEPEKVVGDDETAADLDAKAEALQGTGELDPMDNDVFDSEEMMNRR